jgi:tetratricopeptide (TPR) repeat protein
MLSLNRRGSMIRGLRISLSLLAIVCTSLAAFEGNSWEAARRKGEIAREQGKYQEAAVYLREALARAGFDAQDLERADLDDELAGMYQLLGDTAGAESLYMDALSVIEKHTEKHTEKQPEDSTEAAGVRATVLGGLGLFRARQGRLGEAQDLFERALAGCRLVFEEPDLRIALLKSGLGQVYMMQGRLADAESLLQSAVEAQRALPQASARDRIVSETSLGTVYMMERLYIAAEPLLQHAAEEARHLGDSSPAYAGALGALADLYRAEGKPARGEPLLRKARAIYEAAFGPDSPRVAEILLDQSIDTMAAKKLSLAEKEIDRALEILRKANGPDDPSAALAETRLAQTYLQQGTYAEAERLLKHALPIEEKMWPEGHYLIADSLYGLAEVERLQGRAGDAELQYRLAISAFEKAGDRGTAGLAVSLLQYSKLLRTTRADEARAFEKRARELQKGLQTFR